MADRTIERLIQKEHRRVLNILRAMPMPINPHLTGVDIDNIFARAERRARITVLSTYDPKEDRNNGDE